MGCIDSAAGIVARQNTFTSEPLFLTFEYLHPETRGCSQLSDLDLHLRNALPPAVDECLSRLPNIFG